MLDSSFGIHLDPCFWFWFGPILVLISFDPGSHSGSNLGSRSGFFSGSETSLTSASKPTMHELAKSGDKKAKLFTKIFKDKEMLIGTILFANNLVNVLASAIATKILIEITNDDGIVYATLIMTLMILIFGELIPKTIALSNSDKFALKIARDMGIIYHQQLFKYKEYENWNQIQM